MQILKEEKKKKVFAQEMFGELLMREYIPVGQ